jgi:Polysaccharide lyase family 8, C-terminal beta-sandwich domain./Polysaccharide lyase family 8, super-sandwich domain./Polysaccharide lyase family 8, N terminal alpha-helical domain.
MMLERNLDRRTVFKLLGAGALSATLLTATAQGASAATPVTLADLIKRRAIMLTGAGSAAGVPQLAAGLKQISDDAAASWQAMTLAAGAPGIWPDLSLAGIGSSATATGNMGVTFDRIFSLAEAYAIEGTAQYGDAALAADLVTALRTLSTTTYTVGMRPAGNWWFWEIGVPRKAADTLVLLYDQVPADLRTNLLAAVRYFAPDPNWRGRGTSFAETGANRSDKSLSCALRGILDDRPDEIALARDALSDVVRQGANGVFGYVTSGDGFYQDGSFIQHTYLPYAGTYGVVTLSGVAAILALLSGSDWAVTDPKKSVVLDAVERTFAPFVWDGRVMDAIRGRAVSRQAEPDYVDGSSLISAVLLLAPGADEPYRSRFLALAKGWLQRCTDVSLVGLPTETVAQSLLAVDVLADSSVVPAPAPIYTMAFGDQDRLVHRRPDWGAVVNISSKRIGRYEWGNDENNLGWYQGDGLLFVYTRQDAAQFSSDFWPTVDPYRLPGTTVNDEQRGSGASGAGTGIPRAYQAFAGGLELDGRWGIQGMDHLNFDKTLAGKKSWFFLDDAIVCLGAAIVGTGGHAVFTTVENRSFAAGAVPHLRTDDRDRVVAPGSAPVSVTRSVHIEGHGGYVFLDAEGVGGTPEVAVVSRQGAWFDVNSGADTGGSTDVKRRDYVTITHPHGTDPRSGGYAYLVLPAVTHDVTFLQSAHPEVTVLANNGTAQVVEQTAQNVVLGNFFAAADGTGTQHGITVSGPCSTAVHRESGRITISLADPSRTQSVARIALPDAGAGSVISADDGVTLVGTAPLTVEFQLDGHGHSKSIVIGM